MVAVGNVADVFLTGQAAPVEPSRVRDEELIAWGVDEVLRQAQAFAEGWSADVGIRIDHELQSGTLGRIDALEDLVIVIVLQGGGKAAIHLHVMLRLPREVEDIKDSGRNGLHAMIDRGR